MMGMDWETRCARSRATITWTATSAAYSSTKQACAVPWCAARACFFVACPLPAVARADARWLRGWTEMWEPTFTDNMLVASKGFKGPWPATVARTSCQNSDQSSSRAGELGVVARAPASSPSLVGERELAQHHLSHAIAVWPNVHRRETVRHVVLYSILGLQF